VFFASGNESVQVFDLPFVSISIAIEYPIIKGIGIPLTNLTPPP
jgi:hypothetical protein